MTKPTISSYLREHTQNVAAKKEPGPYVTISRQWGCDGIDLGKLLVDKLNERDEEKRWKFYHKDILHKLADDTGLSLQLLEKERSTKPSIIKDLLRGLKPNSIPDGIEIRNKITAIVRDLAFSGYAVILGQGSTAAIGDLPNGLSLRVMAPKDWRIARIGLREGLGRTGAIARIEEVEAERERLRKFYERQNPRDPAFNLVFDNSAFTNEQITKMILLAMEERKLIVKLEDMGKNT